MVLALHVPSPWGWLAMAVMIMLGLLMYSDAGRMMIIFPGSPWWAGS